jgi:stress response protein SCP2
MEAIDFSNTVSLDCSVMHSGDVIDHAGRSGKHTITIDLVKLSPAVKCFYVTVSAYGNQTLKSIRDAQVLFIDPDTSQELCQYHHGDRETHKETCCIMAKMERDSPKGQWKVKAIGHVGMGRAPCYEPVQKSILDNYL